MASQYCHIPAFRITLKVQPHQVIPIIIYIRYSIFSREKQLEFDS